MDPEADPAPEPATATLAGARDHARAQAGAAAATSASVPVAGATDLPGGAVRERLCWDETLGAGGYGARRLRRDTILHVGDLGGDACVNLQLVNAHDTADRFNPPDTVKVQWQAYLGAGAVLLSGQGRVLATIVADTSGRHDALCGHGNRASHEARYGHGGVHGPSPAPRDLLALGLARFGLGRRDVGAGVNLFKGVRVGDDGGLTFDGIGGGPSWVRLRCEVDLIVVAANAPHPLDPRPDYTVSPVRLTAWGADRPDPDPFRDTSPERRRAFENTEDHLLGVPS
jgi:urea carboxylase-associated protein 2